MKEPNIKAVVPASRKTVEITWASGKTDRVNLAALIKELAALAEIDNAVTFSAVALGITRRMVSYYEAGRYLIPRMVGLAIKGWETERNHLSHR